MNLTLLSHDPATFAAPLLVVFAVDLAPRNPAPHAQPSLALLSTADAITNLAAPWLTTGEFKAALGETLPLNAPAGLKAARLLVIGLGNARTFTPHDLRKAAGVAVRYAKARCLHNIALAFPEDRALDDEHLDRLPCSLSARALAEGALLADFDIDFYRTDRSTQPFESVTILHQETEPKTCTALAHGLAEGITLGQSQNWARTLVNEPGNVLTPTELGRRAAAMASATGLACEVHSTAKLRELGMGAFLAVTQGSPEPPALIVLRYTPQNTLQETAASPAPGAPVLALVGKGITFDTGGISIKPADNMDKMKYDMAGAAAMLGAMRAIALLKPAVSVLCIVCSCENMPDGTAFKPGDVVTAMSGKTIEIMNTDAEGRLVLADGLHYAQTLGATHLIDAATLTGAIGVALGLLNTGLFSNDDATAQRLLDTTPVSGEAFWRMPCTDDYRDQIKSQIADIQNTGLTRYGGAITAAMFLKEFVGETPHAPGVPIPWIHLDIAGTAWVDDQKPWSARGPSGVAIRSITEWVRSYAT